MVHPALLTGTHKARNTMYSTQYLLFGAMSILTAGSVAVAAIEGPVGRDAEKGDPSRWSRPADTPQKQYDNAMQEASAALAEALRDCRADAQTRKACEAEARSRYEDDVESARGLLVRHNLARVTQ
jgi:hypothetical protein